MQTVQVERTEWDDIAYPSESKHLLDPVAILRAANGERATWDALTRPEQNALVDWVGLTYGDNVRIGVLDRLGFSDPVGDRRRLADSSRRRISRGRPVRFDPGIWAALVPFHEPESVPDWEAYYGHPLKRSSQEVDFPPTKYDPPRGRVRPQFGLSNHDERSVA